MKSFFKTFFAALLAIVVFCGLCILVFLGIIAVALSSPGKATIAPRSVLVVDLGQPLLEQKKVSPVNALLRRGSLSTPGLHDVITLIHYAAGDNDIKGIYLKIDDDPNGFATNEELRNALLRFKKSGKFIYAYGSMIPQRAYYVATAADKIFLNPRGMLDFRGFAMNIMFLKGALDKLDIEPQIFYDGKFKSATEPLRVTQMTEANKIQTKAYLGDLYSHFLEGISKARDIDTGSLFEYADRGMVQTANDALNYHLVDGLKYEDEVMDELKSRAGTGAGSDISLVSLSKYDKSVDTGNIPSEEGKIAVLYAQGDIVDGGNKDNAVEIASTDYIKLIRKLREDDNIKAIVFRVNSPGGSALASDEIWHELMLAKKAKPLVVSMGDYAASGGYYISCVGDTIFAEPNTLTGSIGVFGVIPNLQRFFNDKLGITFDGVKTAQYADMGTISRPLTAAEKKFIQNNVDSTYATFKSRVVAGRKLLPAVVDSIAQGRVWSGKAAIQNGLVDKIGGLNEAIDCAAQMAKLRSYSLGEYPVPGDPFAQLFKSFSEDIHTSVLKSELGDQYQIYRQLKEIKQSEGEIQARLPYDVMIR